MKIRLRRAKEWSSHQTMLIKAVFASRGPVAEVGGGLFSTPLLHWICKSLNRKLITYENEPEFYRFAKKFQSKLHIIRWIENWDDMDFKRHWGVVLIDHTPNLPQRRAIDVISFKDTADYIVVHDTYLPEHFNYGTVWPHFKYRYDWTECKQWTTVVSNFYDVTKWDNNILHF